MKRGIIDSERQVQQSAAMKGTTVKPLWQCLAALVFLLWIGASAVCTAHCTLGSSVAKGAETESHSCCPAPDQAAHSSPGDAGSSGIVCATLKNFDFTKSGDLVAQPAATLLYLLDVDSFSLKMDARLSGVHSRQAAPSDLVFTPEVSLGPAFRSLAPPVLFSVEVS